jgi:hypothetical protein
MADERRYVHVAGSDDPANQRWAGIATEEVRKAVIPIIERLEPAVLMDGLISVWLDLMLEAFGVAATDETLRRVRKDLARFAAARRAMQAAPKDRPDA